VGGGVSANPAGDPAPRTLIMEMPVAAWTADLIPHARITLCQDLTELDCSKYSVCVCATQ